MQRIYVLPPFFYRLSVPIVFRYRLDFGFYYGFQACRFFFYFAFCLCSSSIQTVCMLYTACSVSCFKNHLRTQNYLLDWTISPGLRGQWPSLICPGTRSLHSTENCGTSGFQAHLLDSCFWTLSTRLLPDGALSPSLAQVPSTDTVFCTDGLVRLLCDTSLAIVSVGLW